MSLEIKYIEIQELRGFKITGVKLNLPLNWIQKCDCVEELAKLEDIIKKQTESIIELKEIVYALTGRDLIPV